MTDSLEGGSIHAAPMVRGERVVGARLLDKLGERGLLLVILGESAMAPTADLLPGTLDMLILKAVSLKPLHGYGVLLRIQQISGHVLSVPQGSLYPALYRLEHQGLIAAEWGTSDNNRKAKFYTLTTPGRRRLREETTAWNRMAGAIAAAMRTTPDEV
jgi:PadR family transcriptional regulator PadR